MGNSLVRSSSWMTGSGTVDHHQVARLEVAGHLHGAVGGQAGADLDLRDLVGAVSTCTRALPSAAVTTAATGTASTAFSVAPTVHGR